MGIDVNPGIVTSGLAFYYDGANPRSYVGPPITNLAKELTHARSDSANALFPVTIGTEDVYIPTLGRVSAKYIDVMNNYPDSGDCCPSLFTYGSDSATSASTLHTYAIVYKSANGYTSDNFMYRYEYNGATYLTESGVFNTTNRIHLGDGWYWAWNTFTTNAAITKFGYTAMFMYEYGKHNRIYVAKVLLCQGDQSGLHPSLWPAVNTTRTTAQIITDLTARNSITANSLTYNSTGGAPTFNGSSNYMRPTIAHSYLSPSCIEVVFRKNAVSGRKYLVGYRHNSGYSLPTIGSMYFVDNALKASLITTTEGYRELTSSTTISANQFYHVCFNKDTTNGLMEIFVNGVSTGSLSFNQTTFGQWSSPGSFIGSNELDIGKSSNDSSGQGWGADFFDGQMPIVKVYDRILTPAEVQQNFNAIRGRYGI